MTTGTALRIIALAWALALLCVSPARAACSPEANHALGSAAAHWGIDVTIGEVRK